MRIRKYHINPGYLLGIASLVLLLGLSLATISPLVPSHVQATDCQPGEAPCTTTLAETNVDLMVASTVSVALASQVQLEVIPRSSGAFTSSTSKLTVATNNPSGYAVYMQASQSQDGNANLVSSDLSNPSTIAPVEGQVSGSSFQNNTWGYSLDGDNYQAIPATTSLVKETTTTTFNDTYDLSFGVQVDTNLPAGQYTNSVIISAVANPIEITSLNQLTYMQDMTSDICTNTAENITKQLIDTRDGKSYWVAKLKDGNCWMTQNLALDLSTSRTLTPADTDVTSNWTPSSNTETALSTADASDLTTTKSWNLGQFISLTPNSTSSCYNNLTLGENINDLSCVSLIDVRGWSPTYTAQDNTITRGDFVRKTVDDKITWIPLASAAADGADKDENGKYTPFSFSGYVTANLESHLYDAHYLIGNYYQFNTATAGQGTGTVNTNAETSICPKGWELPRGTNAYHNVELARSIDKSYSRLLPFYGWNLWIWVDSNGVDQGIRADTKNPQGLTNRQQPTYFTTGGSISNESMDGVDGIGVLWSAIYLSGAYREVMYNNGGSVSPTNNHYRGGCGLPIRCIAR